MLRPWHLATRASRRRGAMLVMTMMLLALIWFALLAFSGTTLHALRNSANFLGSERAAAAAEAGLVYGIAELQNDSDWQTTDPLYKLSHVEEKFRLELLPAHRSPLEIPEDSFLLKSTGISRTGQTRVATAVIRVEDSGGGLFDYAIFADSIKTSGGVSVEAFDSATGRKAKGEADIATNSEERGSVRLNGGVTVDGIAWVGEEGRVGDDDGRTWGSRNVVWKNGSSTTLGERQLADELEFPEIEVPEGSKKDESVKVNANKSESVEPGRYKDLKLSGSGVAELAAGTYVFDSVSVGGAASLSVSGDGPVVIYVRDELKITGGTLSNGSKTPRNLIFLLGEDAKVKISGGSEVYAVLYGPESTMKITGGSRVYGAAVAEEISLSGGPHFVYDLNLKEKPPSIPGVKGGSGGSGVSVLSWRRY